VGNIVHAAILPTFQADDGIDRGVRRENARIFPHLRRVSCRVMNITMTMSLKAYRMKTVFVCIVLLGLSWPAPAVSAPADPAHTAAVFFVQRQHVGANLNMLALTVASRTAAFTVLIDKVGVANAKRMVAGELAKQAPQFQPQWDANLALIYAHYFTADELTSLAAEGRNSAYAARLAGQQGAIGADMQRISTPLLTRYVSAALQSALAAARK
jgi:hypothetical protein